MDDELLKEFAADIRERLDDLLSAFAELKNKPGGINLINRVFRDIHTIKAGCGFLGLDEMEKVLHEAENILAHLSDQNQKILPEQIEVVARAIEQIKILAASHERQFSDAPKTLADACAGLPALVSDLVMKTGKPLDLKIQGDNIPLRSQSFTAVRTALLHIVRNAAVHGIELPSERQRLGKPETGTISVKAQKAGGGMTLEISDDGAGIPAELHGLIFKPGFTTAGHVSTLAGRGAGLDAVAADIAAAGGLIKVQSDMGSGTSFLITLPPAA